MKEPLTDYPDLLKRVTKCAELTLHKNVALKTKMIGLFFDMKDSNATKRMLKEGRIKVNVINPV